MKHASKSLILFILTVTVAYRHIIHYPQSHPHQMVMPDMTDNLDYQHAESYMDEDVAGIRHEPLQGAPEVPRLMMPEVPDVEVPMPEPYFEDHSYPVAPAPEYEIGTGGGIGVPMPPPPVPIPFADPGPMQELRMAPNQPPPWLEEVVNYHPPVVPEARELSAFVMPELPVKIAPVHEPYQEQLIPVTHVPEYIPLPQPMPMPIEDPYERAYNGLVVPEVYNPMVIPRGRQIPTYMPLCAAEPRIAQYPDYPDQDYPVAVPQLVQPHYGAVPAYPKVPLSQILINRPQHPWLRDMKIIVPQQPQLIRPITVPLMSPYSQPAVDPCQLRKQAMMPLAPYFARRPYYMPMSFVPSRNNFHGMRVIPYMRQF